MEHWETIKSEDTQGFHIVCSAKWEDTHPRDLFDDSCCDVQEICEKIDRGLYVWFVARVEAYKHGILLGTDYLGNCLYDSFEQFKNDEYYFSMVDAAINEAKQNLQKLTNEVTA
jgi:hypothetical protein